MQDVWLFEGRQRFPDQDSRYPCSIEHHASVGLSPMRAGASQTPEQKHLPLQSVRPLAPTRRLLAHRPEVQDFKQWRCIGCQRPTCQLCGVREETALNRPVDPCSYVCQKCTYPPCAGGCGALRYRREKYRAENMPTWFCVACKGQQG